MDKLQQVFNLCNNKQFDEALPILEEITKNDPQNSEAWRTLAQIHWFHLHQPDKAYDELIEALRCDPTNLWALVLMGNLLTKEKNDIDGAKTYYDKVLEYHPDNAIAINNVAATYMERKDYDAAIPLMEKVISIDDTYINPYYGLGLCYYKTGKLKEAFDVCHKAATKLKDRPENPGVRDELLALFMTVAKEIAKSFNYMHVCNGIKDELEAIDHIKIRFVEDTSLKVLAKLEYAPTHAAKEHVVRYNPEKQFVSHLFVHELMHLKMNQQATIAKRGKVVMCSQETFAAFSKRYMPFMKKKHSHIPSSEMSKVMSGISEGLGLQLMNCPLDLFVEHLIYSEYKVVRPIQMVSLFQMEMNNIESVKQATKNGFFPAEIVSANKVMNIVSSMHFKELYGIDIIKEYHPTKQEFEHAKDLYEEFKAYLDTFKAGDEFEMIEYFVESFNMEDLIEIMDESQMTPGMKADVSLQSDLKKQAENALSPDDVDVANAQFALDHQDGGDPTETMMMSMYMLGAMKYFDKLEARDVHRIALEIAMVGVSGIHPDKKYNIKSIPEKEFGGFELLAYYYVSWARAIPDMLDKLGLPFSKAYEAALQMYNAKKG